VLDWRITSDDLQPSKHIVDLLELRADAPVRTWSQFASYIHPRDADRVRAKLIEHLHGNSRDLHCEFRLVTTRGRARWALARGRVVQRDGAGRALRFLGTLRDVTAALDTRQELERQLERSQAAIRMSTALALEVKQLEGEIREISERERARIGHDLHDGLGQELTGVSLMLKALADGIERDAPKLCPRVRSLREMVEQCIATTRSLAQGLAPVHLDRDGLVGALGQLAVSSEAMYGVPVTFVSHSERPIPALEAATDLYRIAQEAIRNAARHSGAREIRLTLELVGDRLSMVVQDDGHGMPEDMTASRGMGLKIMRYRASIVGASLEIGAREGGGTVVRCAVRIAGNGANGGEAYE
jgi:signal transduction histidine kinase